MVPSLKRHATEHSEMSDTDPFSSEQSPPAPKRPKQSDANNDSKLKSKRARPATDEEQVADATTAEDVASRKTFHDLGIIEELCDATKQLGFKHPTPIQEQSIPIALEGRDIIGLAETGSGKTAAFALPMLQALLQKPQPLFGLVLAPTRELAFQTAQQIEALGSVIAVKCAVIVGGMSMAEQSMALSRGPHIIVAAPGRLLDHLENTKGFSLRKLQYLVMDEADKLLDQDFGPILDKIIARLPQEGRRTYLFSATMSSKVQGLTRASLRNPVKVSVSADAADGQMGTGPKHRVVSQLLQSFCFIPHKYKDHWLVALLTGPFAGHSAIVFARTVHEVARITLLLRALNVGAIPLHGQLSQSSRLAALNKFKSHNRDVLCATDVAARGLDIPSVDVVLNYDLPGDSTTYVHRVGRTARAGKSGHALSLVTQYDVEVWLRIEKAIGRKIDQYQGVTQEEALVHSDTVNTAQKEASSQLREQQRKEQQKKKQGRVKPGKQSGKRSRDDMDLEEG